VRAALSPFPLVEEPRSADQVAKAKADFDNLKRGKVLKECCVMSQDGKHAACWLPKIPCAGAPTFR